MVEQPNNHIPNQPNDENGDGNNIEMVDNFSDSDEEDYFPESSEFESIDNQLNVLNSALDDIENKNDNIVAELKALLNENREIRKQIQECKVENSEVQPQSN